MTAIGGNTELRSKGTKIETGDLLLRRGRGDGTVAIPCRRPMRADWPDVLYRDWSSRPPPSGLRWQVPRPGLVTFPAPVRISH
jgi:hypothetical protein